LFWSPVIWLTAVLARGLAAINELRRPSGRQITAEEYTLRAGPVLAQIFFDRRPVSDSFVGTVAGQWLATLDRAGAQ
jgi:hypothetical protein